MGLDMYLRAEKYVSGYEFYGEEKTEQYRNLVAAFGAEDVVDPSTPSATVSFTVAYWRKANAIHKWFVDNVQEGVDDCREYWVGREQLTELRDACQEVLDSLELEDGKVRAGMTYHPGGKIEQHWEDGRVATDTAVAQELLPAAEGFFFGGTDYDEWYVQNLEETVRQINRLLKLDAEWDFQYQSSW